MKKYRTSQTDFLFAKPSFLSGMARTLDMHGDFCQYNISDSSEEADVKALICDWLVIQQDLNDSWKLVIDNNPILLNELVEYINSDPELRRTVLQAMTKEEKVNELEMAPQGA